MNKISYEFLFKKIYHMNNRTKFNPKNCTAPKWYNIRMDPKPKPKYINYFKSNVYKYLKYLKYLKLFKISSKVSKLLKINKNKYLKIIENTLNTRNIYFVVYYFYFGF